MQDANSSVALGALSDKYYVNGMSLSWTSPADRVPVALADLDRTIWGDGQQRVAFSLVQQIYTPSQYPSNPPRPR